MGSGKRISPEAHGRIWELIDLLSEAHGPCTDTECCALGASILLELISGTCDSYLAEWLARTGVVLSRYEQYKTQEVIALCVGEIIAAHDEDEPASLFAYSVILAFHSGKLLSGAEHGTVIQMTQYLLKLPWGACAGRPVGANAGQAMEVEKEKDAHVIMGH